MLQIVGDPFKKILCKKTPKTLQEVQFDLHQGHRVLSFHQTTLPSLLEINDIIKK